MYINTSKLEKSLRRDRKRKNKRKMIVDNRSIVLLEQLAEKKDKKIRKKRKQRRLIKENGDGIL